MKLYVLVMRQEGGCDYTIGCGIKVVEIHANTDEEAKAISLEILDDHGPLDETTIYEVKATVPFDHEAAWRVREAASRQETLQAAEDEERALYERLKLKFEGSTPDPQA